MTQATEPPVRIVHGAPDPEAVAALALLLLANAGRSHAAEAEEPSAGWRPARSWRPPGSWTSA